MEVHPFHLILGHDMIKLRLHERHIAFHLLFAPPPGFDPLPPLGLMAVPILKCSL